jgi:hypothetical protein
VLVEEDQLTHVHTVDDGSDIASMLPGRSG